MSLSSRARTLSLSALIAGAVALVIALVTLAAPATDPADARPRAAGLTGLNSCGKLRGYLAKHRDAFGTTGVGGMPFIVEEGAAPTADVGGGTGYAPLPPDSGTNVQEAGVDEPDIVKTAGSTIFTVDGATLRAVDTSSEAPVAAGSLQLPDGAGDDATVGDYQLLLAGDRLLAVGTSYGYAMPIEGPTADGVVAPDVAYPSAPPRVWILEIDVSDPAAMTILRTEKVDGSFVSARLTGSTARLVTSNYPSGPFPAAGKGRKLLPQFTMRDRTTQTTRRGRLGSCSTVSHPARFSGSGMLSVLTVDMDRGLPAVDVDSILTDGDIVYGSTGALYVSTERWLDPERSEVPPASNVVTEIHRFDTSDPSETAYTASGAVDGYMLSQWSMSEHEGILRVASTTSPPFDQTGEQQVESESYVTAFATTGEKLARVGRVGGLGRTEQIYAVRFMGDVGYVVTFRQTDPLYTLDLSDPTAPRVVGELKIPGYSAYLHPVGEGLLLGVGQDADSSGRTEGLLASLFDVSDPANPVRIDTEGFGAYATSEVEYDHHAFSWFADHSLAVLPVDSYYPSEFFGAAGLRITPGGEDPLGRVAKVSRGSSYEDAIRRSVELGGRIYTVAATGIDAYDPATMARLGSLDY